MPDPDILTAADIARLAGVTRATVSNWKRRHADFPAPVGGTAASPAYVRSDVEAWLARRDALPELPAGERLWRSVRAAISDGMTLADLATATADFLAKAGQADSADAATPPLPGDLARTLTEAANELGMTKALDTLIVQYAAEMGALATATPEPVAELMTALASPGAEDVVLDPAVGTGNLLFSARKYGVSRLLGQDLDISVAGLSARRRSRATDQSGIVFRKGDSLRDDQFADLRADVVLCHPPFGIADWGIDELADDPRWVYGTPPRAEGEMAWVQHSLAHLRPGGRAVLLMPPAAASRPSGRRVRAELVRRGALRGVVSLPPGAVEPRNIPVHIWVLEHPIGQGSPDPHLLLMDAAHLGTSWPSATDEIRNIWATHRASEVVGGELGFWQIVKAVDLLDDAIDITPGRHVGAATQAWSGERTATELQAIQGRLRDSLDALSAYYLDGDWNLEEQGARWRTADITDLGHWNSVAFHRASTTAPADHEPAKDIGRPEGRPVLRASDVDNGKPPSGAAPDGPVQPGWVVIQQGDVIIPASAGERMRARVAGQHDQGAILGRGLHLIRPDLERLDPWFLSGFLASPVNAQLASAGSTSSRIDIRRLVVPLIPLEDQQRYGAEFRKLHDAEAVSRDLAAMTTRISRLLGDNLAAGRLKPRTESPETVQTACDMGGEAENSYERT